MQSIPNELTVLLANLPSGYHRDLQLTKEILFPAFEELKACIRLTLLMLSHIEVKQHILDDPKYTYLFTVEAVNEKVNSGVPFREAYRQVGNDIENGTFHFDSSKGLNHTHEGSIGNLNNAEIGQLFQKVMLKFS
jgi:argininosuccinate lyase